MWDHGVKGAEGTHFGYISLLQGCEHQQMYLT